MGFISRFSRNVNDESWIRAEFETVETVSPGVKMWKRTPLHSMSVSPLLLLCPVSFSSESLRSEKNTFRTEQFVWEIITQTLVVHEPS